MAFIALFSFVSLALTLPVGTGAPQRCMMHMTSTYSSVLQYCSSEYIKDETKATVCDEILPLFEKFCSFNRPGFHFPEPQNVSKENCALLCAGLDLKYILSMFNITSGSCRTSCTVDPEAGAVLLTLFQLKGLIDELEPKKEKTVATNSTLAQTKQITSTSKAAVTTKTEEPKVSSTTAAVTTKTEVPDVSSAAAAVTTKTEEPKVSSATESKRKEQVVATVTNSTSVQLQQSTSASEASRRMSPSPPKGKLTTTASGRTSLSTTEPNVKSSTTVQGKTTPKGEDVETNTTVQGKTTPKGEDVGVETTTTEDIDNNQIHTNEGPDTESEETDEVHVTGPGTESEETDEVHGSNKIKEQPISNNGQGLTDEKDDTPSSYHFLIYFLAFIVLCVASYIVFHNKHKIIAFVIEGKQGRRGGRPSTKQYTPLKSKVEDVMPSIEKSTTQSNYIY